MKNMKVGKNKPRHYTPGCSIYTHDQKQREKAVEVLRTIKETKNERPVNYLHRKK